MDIGKAVAITLYIKKRGKVTAKELAEKFEIERKSIIRLVKNLSFYFPIYTERGWKGGICWLKAEEARG